MSVFSISHQDEPIEKPAEGTTPAGDDTDKPEATPANS